ncbi:MAG: hypothetical protein ACR2RE_19950 [Geminicoccaceae bacterium]
MSGEENFGPEILVILFVILLINHFTGEIKKEEERQKKSQNESNVIFYIAGIVALFALLTKYPK